MTAGTHLGRKLPDMRGVSGRRKREFFIFTVIRVRLTLKRSFRSTFGLPIIKSDGRGEDRQCPTVVMAIGQTDAISSNLLDYIHSLSDSAEQICLEKLGNLLNTLTVGEAYELMYACR